MPLPPEGSNIKLVDLPHDILWPIIELLTPHTGPVFVPTAPEDSDLDVQIKTRELYGKQSNEQIRRSKGLLSWSSTCHYFRTSIFPLFLKTVLLRNTGKSVKFVKALSETNYWSLVEHVIFIGTEPQVHQKRVTVPSLQDEMPGLVTILSSLPPNLTMLTLDFPKAWDLASWADALSGHGRSDDIPAQKEATNSYRTLLQTVLDLVSKHSVSKQSHLELRLFNIPPFRCSVFEQTQFNNWLGQCRSFTLALCRWSHLQSIDGPMAGLSVPKLRQWFWNHLDNVETLHLFADATCPLAGSQPSLSLPTTLQHLAMLKHVSLKTISVCRTMTDFLVARASQLVSVKLIDCFALTVRLHGETKPMTWACFFDTLVDANFERLVSFEYAVEEDESNIEQTSEGSVTHPDVECVTAKSMERYGEDAGTYQESIKSSHRKERRRLMFRYCTMRGSDWVVFVSGRHEKEHHSSGKDSDAYSRLIDIVEENIARQRDA